MKLPNQSAQAIITSMAEDVINVINQADEPLSLWALGHILAGSILATSGSFYGGDAKQITINESELSSGINAGLNDYAADFGMNLKLADIPAGKELH